MTNLKTIEKIKNAYVEKQHTKIDELKELNKKVYRPAKVFAYSFGTVGSLVLGGGMCLVMPEVVTGYMALGIAIGVVGLITVIANWFLYKKIVKSRKRKYASKIIELSNQILNEN